MDTLQDILADIRDSEAFLVSFRLSILEGKARLFGERG